MLRHFNINQEALEQRMAFKNQLKKDLQLLTSLVVELLTKRFLQPDINYIPSDKLLNDFATDALIAFMIKYKKDHSYIRTLENEPYSADLFLNLDEFNKIARDFARLYIVMRRVENSCDKARAKMLENIKSKPYTAAIMLGQFGLHASPEIKVYRNKSVVAKTPPLAQNNAVDSPLDTDKKELRFSPKK